jgi:hypothetical protein
MRRRSAQAADDEEWAAMVERATDPLADRPSAEAPRSAAGDSSRLRGIPMIGGGQGAIPGTVPHQQKRLERWTGCGKTAMPRAPGE